jgi:hypothetical protein
MAPIPLNPGKKENFEQVLLKCSVKLKHPQIINLTFVDGSLAHLFHSILLEDGSKFGSTIVVNGLGHVQMWMDRIMLQLVKAQFGTELLASNGFTGPRQSQFAYSGSDTHKTRDLVGLVKALVYDLLSRFLKYSLALF